MAWNHADGGDGRPPIVVPLTKVADWSTLFDNQQTQHNKQTQKEITNSKQCPLDMLH
jgi:hypothetical protein